MTEALLIALPATPALGALVCAALPGNHPKLLRAMGWFFSLAVLGIWLALRASLDGSGELLISVRLDWVASLGIGLHLGLDNTGFLLAGMLYERTHSRELSVNAGLGRLMPGFVFFLGLYSLSSLAFPGTASFVGEFLCLSGAFAHSWRVGAWVIPGALLAAAYMFRMFITVTWGKGGDTDKARDINVREWASLLPPALLVILFGFYPAPLLKMMDPVLTEIISRLPTEKTIDIANSAKRFQSAHPEKEFIGLQYPLMQKQSKSSLSPFFISHSQPVKPNIVIIICESLSNSVSGKYGNYISITPFVDSLASQSLYWPNAVSSSERTFGVLPSVLSSLPQINTGFLDLEKKS